MSWIKTILNVLGLIFRLFRTPKQAVVAERMKRRADRDRRAKDRSQWQK